MKTEIRCPDCNNLWNVDAAAGGEMLCPTCLTRIPLDVTADEPRVIHSPAAADSPPDTAPCEPASIDAQPAHDRDASPVGNPATSSALESVDLPSARVDRMPEEIVCPRCSLHFHPRSRPKSPSGERRTVLVVDDLAYFRQLAKDALEPTFVVKTASTSAEARDLLRRGGIDLLVLDLTLDGRDAGVDLLRELVPKPCPILIFTAQDESEMYGAGWDELKTLGADDLVMKGIKVAESLLRKTSSMLGVAVDEEQPIR